MHSIREPHHRRAYRDSDTPDTLGFTGNSVIALRHRDRSALCAETAASRPFLHLGVSNGFTYDLSKTINASNKCTSVSVTNVMLNGVALNPATTYYVTVNNFLVDGGDNFVTFRQVSPTLRVGGGIDLDELNNYLASEGPIVPPGTNRVNEIP